MTTISASSTIGIYLTSPSFTNPVVIDPGVTISTSGNALYGFTGTWTIENSGHIASTLGNGVYLGSGGLITNAASASISGFDAVNIAGGLGTVVNNGSIAGNAASSIGVLLAAGGSVTNQSGGTISGYTGVDLISGGAVTNAASAVITGVYDGVGISGGTGTVVNHGNVAGTVSGGDGILLGSGGSIINAAAASIAGDAFGVDLSAGGTLTNAGTIIGNAGTAVYFGGTSSNLLVLDPGYGLSGIAMGGTSASNTLELASAASAGTLSGLGTQFLDFGQVTIGADASWVLNGANTIEAGTTLTELSGATLTASGTLVNDGTIVLDPSTLTAGGLTGIGLVTIDAGSTLGVQGTVAAGETLMLAGSGAYLHLNAPGSVSGSVTQFALHETIDLKGINPASVSYSGGLLSFSGGSFALSLASPGSVTASPSSDGAAVSVACFCAGTLIRTERGDVAVETLAVGDRVVTAAGAVRPVIWIGHRRIECARHPDPTSVWPVRVAAGAFGEDLPHRDLWLSPDHAVFVGEVLIPVRYLVNGSTVVQQTDESVEDRHVELAEHSVIYAEGLPAESYLDTGNRSVFANGGCVVDLHPDFAWRIWQTRSCAPLVLAGPKLSTARRRLLARAADLGHLMTSDPALRVFADGMAVPAERHGQIWRMHLPDGVTQVRLVSRVWHPAHIRPTSDDTRSLGVAISRLWLDGREANLDGPHMSHGWNALETGWRWTNGDAVLAASRSLAFQVAMTGTYWLDEDGAERVQGLPHTDRRPALRA